MTYRLSRLITAATLAILAAAADVQALTYDIVYVRQPRFGDSTNTTWPEVFHPARIDPGADLMLLHPDGSEEVLVAAGNGAVTDPFVSFDAQWVYYSFFPDVRPEAVNYQRGLPYEGADIYRLHLATRAIEQLTHGEFTPNTGAARWYRDGSGRFQPVDTPNPYQWDHLGYGILNLGPAPVAGGRIAFTSNRNGFTPPKPYTSPTLQLFVMDADGSNVRAIAPMNISSALHPTPLQDGRLMFSSHESQGLRDARLWGIWSIFPDGRQWAPIASAFRDAQAFHFMTQLGNGDIVLVDYYNLNNNGFGALYRIPPPPLGEPAFHSAFVEDNPPIQQTVGAGFSYPFQMPFTPKGMYSITPFTTGEDEAAPIGAGGTRVGKFTHPSAAPNNDLLVAWTAGPANDLNRPSPQPYYDSGIYLIPDGGIVTSPSQLVRIKNDPDFNEAWPRAVVPYQAIHGIPEPARLPWLPNDGVEHPQQLPAGTPYGLVGTSSLYKRESFPGRVASWSDTFDGLDAFNTSENGQSSNWFTQGSDAGKYTDPDIWAIRLIAMEPGTHRSYGPNGGPSGGQLFFSHANERLRILGEIPVRKFDGNGAAILDPEGNPDTSFLARIPADTPFTFQVLDRNGMALTTAQTWHQVRPGEARYDCGGCHAHSQQPLAFEATAAHQPTYEPYDLGAVTPLLTHDAAGQPDLQIADRGVVDVEFVRDIRPILQRSCVGCHTRLNPSPPGNLVLDDDTLYDGLPGDYARLANDPVARWGYPPLIGWGDERWWRQTNASRYVRMLQSRRSLLAWKVFGARLDGWQNADHPTESVPGDPTTLPVGTSANAADVDYTGTIMPPPGSGVPALSIDEKMAIARWIDLGCPINLGTNGSSSYGWFLDEVRPALTISEPHLDRDWPSLESIVIGAADANSGLDVATLSVTANFAIDGRAPGTELADLASGPLDGIFRIDLSEPIAVPEDGAISVEIRDRQGNTTWERISRNSRTATPPSSGMCDAAPMATCRQAGQSRLKLRTGSAAQFRLMWKGTAAAPVRVGSPTSSTEYRLCLYRDDASPALLAGTTLPAGPRWRGHTDRFRYRNSGDATVRGASIAVRRNERVRIAVQGGRSGSPFANLPLRSGDPVRVQFLNDEGECWDVRGSAF